jgi:hypothetical protein
VSNPRNGVIQLKEGGTTKYSDFSLFKKVIVSKGAEETFLVSADVYCQNQNNPFRLHINDL